VRMRIRLAIAGSQDVFIIVADGHAEVGLQPTPEPDVSFLFHDIDTAWRILGGQENAIEAFMQGRFRADGYLMMAFKLMEIFGSLSLPPTPND
jgi:putative sterol carrier protein